MGFAIFFIVSIILIIIILILLIVSSIITLKSIKPILNKNKEYKIKNKYERHYGIQPGMTLKQLNDVMKDFKPKIISDNEIIYESSITISNYGFYIKNTIVVLENNIVLSKKSFITNKGVRS